MNSTANWNILALKNFERAILLIAHLTGFKEKKPEDERTILLP